MIIIADLLSVLARLIVLDIQQVVKVYVLEDLDQFVEELVACFALGRITRSVLANFAAHETVLSVIQQELSVDV